MSVAEWVRRALRDACARRQTAAAEKKLEAIRRAARYSFPTCHIGQMLSEIERGYRT